MTKQTKTRNVRKPAASSASKHRVSTSAKLPAKKELSVRKSAKAGGKPTTAANRVSRPGKPRPGKKTSSTKKIVRTASKNTVKKKVAVRPAQSAARASTTKGTAAQKQKKGLQSQTVHKKTTVNKSSDMTAPARSTELAKSITRETRKKVSASKPVAVASKQPARKGVPKAIPQKKAPANPKVLRKIRMIQSQRDATKDISNRPRTIQAPSEADPFWNKEPQKDQIGLFVRDPYWLHVAWDVTRVAIERAQAAMAEQWHGAKPVLRLMRLDDAGSSTSAETLQADIEIRGGVRNWYIPWTGQAASFRVNIGYLGLNGRFHLIAVSNSVRTPDASAQDAVDDHWSHLGPEGEKIFALSGGYDSSKDSGELKAMLERRLHRSLGAPELARLAVAADMPTHYRSDFFFDMEVELVFYGATLPSCFVTINEEPVSLRPDGTFALRLPFPDRRHVIPAVAVTRDGSHQKTIVVGVERNTKVMEPFERENDNSD